MGMQVIVDENGKHDYKWVDEAQNEVMVETPAMEESVHYKRE